MSRALAEALSRLQDAGGELAASRFSADQKKVLEQFMRTTGAVQLQTRGRGNIYRVIQPQVFAAHLQQLRPVHAQELADVPVRAGNVARFRDSKGGQTRHAQGYLLLKAVGDGVRWQDGEGRDIELAAVTALCGAAALAIRADDDWHSAQPLWLVENQALFDDLSWMPDGAAGSVCYYAGNIPGQLLDWLAARARTPRVVLFADYDGVGLQNYARLHVRLGSVCEFWLMPSWRDLLEKYGNHQLWVDTSTSFHDALARLGELGLPADVAELAESMRLTGRALEQEAVFLQRVGT